MHPWTRPPEPAELSANRDELTRAFIAEKKATGKTPRCNWPKVIGPDGNLETLQQMLSRDTKQHCNYCDGLMGYSSRETIDHFMPKSLPDFEHLVYVWNNLYLCCDGCQRKGTTYNENALRPDEIGYLFERYFRFHLDGRISVIAPDTTDRDRAEITIEVLKLKHPDLTKNRQQEFHRNAKPRRRPLRPGLSPETALLREECLKPSYETLPYRDFYALARDR